MIQRFDLVVIGTGSAATSAAYPCRSAGWKVAIVDDLPFGGTCANRGCDPKKVLVGVADLVDQARRMQGKGFAGDVRIEWAELMRFKRSFTVPVPANREEEFAKAGIEPFHGAARFRSEDTIEIGDAVLTAPHYVIAAGASPARLDIDGENLLLTSDDFLELDRLPEEIVFVGGGYIAFEFAHLAARAGSRVTILHRGKRPLEQFDADLVNQLVSHTRRIGIDLQLETSVERVSGERGRLTVHCSGGKTYQTALAVHAAGRVPNLAELNLPVANVQSARRGVSVNEYLQSISNERVYAAGDAADSGGPPLTPIAGYEGRIVAENLLHGKAQRADYRGVASTVFTIPPLASVGLTEQSAQSQHLDYDVHFQDTSGWYSSRRIAEESSGFKVLVERGTGHILGAHIFGDRSEELINVFALAIRTGLKAEQLRSTLYAYPTHGSNIQYML